MNTPAPGTASPLPAPAAAKLLQGQMCLVYETMARGLAVTTATSALIKYVPAVSNLLLTTWLYYLFALSPLAFALFKLTRNRLMTLPLIKVQAAFYGFSFVIGVSVTGFFYDYESVNILKAFLSATGMFAAMVLYGRATRKNLISLDAFLLMSFFGLIIAAIINLPRLHDTENFIVAGLTLVFLLGLTAWEAQIIREDFEDEHGTEIASPGAQKRLALIGALGLYMNLINLLGFFLFYASAPNKR